MSNSTIPSSDLALHNFSESAIISAAFRMAYKQKKAIALWQLPRSAKKHLIVDLSDGLSHGKIDLEETSCGFVLSPFKNNDGTKSLFIKAHLHLIISEKEREVFQDPSSSEGDITDQLKDELSSDNQSNPLFLNDPYNYPSTRDSYKKMVHQALAEIANGSFLKVVPSVTKSIKLSTDFNPIETFDQLCFKYPNAFKSLVSIPQYGSWMGASPEPLIEIDQHKIFSTAALAGTQAYLPEVSLQEVAWRQKEIEEQALVSRYIINCFKKIRLREFEEVGPKTVLAGNLLHLKSRYTVDMNATNFPQLGTVMLDLLHPTSAVCGMPQAPAQAFIEAHEQFDRAFFSGYLGPVGINEETHCFVNLRCMQIHENSATMYAGAGVTADSNAEMEWKETQLKFDTLLSVLNTKNQ